MSRVEVDNGKYQVAYGVDFGIDPSRGHTFLQVFLIGEPDPGDFEGLDEDQMERVAEGILVSEWDVDYNRVVSVAKQYGVTIDVVDVFKVFD